MFLSFCFAFGRLVLFFTNLPLSYLGFQVCGGYLHVYCLCQVFLDNSIHPACTVFQTLYITEYGR